MTNTIIFFFCLFTSYQIVVKVLESLVNKEKASYLDIYLIVSLFLWALLYYLTHTN